MARRSWICASMPGSKKQNSAAPVALGAVQRQIGIAHQLIGGVSVRQPHGDADAGANDDLVAVDLVGLAHDVDDAARQHGRRRPGCSIAPCTMANSSPPMRATISVSRTSVRRRSVTAFSSLSPAGWPSVSLTCLKWSRSSRCDGDHLATLGARQGVLEPLVEQHAIGQSGQRIVQRHVHDLGLGAALLGDVLMGGDGVAVRHRLGSTPRRSGRRAGASCIGGHACRSTRLSIDCKTSSTLLPGSSPLAMRCSMICRKVVPGFTCSGVRR